MAPDPTSRPVAALFAGIGGVELGLQRSGFETVLACEIWGPAQQVLGHQFPGARLVGDVADLKRLPNDIEVLTAGFPCTDLSQAGRTAGITGEASGLVSHVFRLLQQHEPRWLLLENVRNMLVLDKGQAMRYLVDSLEKLGYSWAYRLVDSRFTGVPQRRQRVILVASRTEDPRGVLLVDDAGEPAEESFRADAFGFYWTEGLRGVGWAKDAIPTLKSGSTVGIPSPPAVWLPGQVPGRALVIPTLEDAEALQGFPRGWTAAASSLPRGERDRWKLLGNAVTTGVAEWIGNRLASPGEYNSDLDKTWEGRWPLAAWGIGGHRSAADVSLWPLRIDYQHLSDLLSLDECPPLSTRAAAGFLGRANRSSLRFAPGFLQSVQAHIDGAKTANV